jgi:hypothetical protein
LKLCKILMGPVSGNEGQLHWEGEEIVLDTPTAELLDRLGYVTVLGDAADGSTLSGKSAPSGDEPNAEEAEEPKAISKRKRTAGSEGD